MWKLERARDPKITWLSLVGLILVPLLVSGGFLWATWDSDSRLGRVQAAIVNNDEGVTLNKQFVPLGRQLAGGLVNGEDDVANFEWVLTDDEDAQQGLSNGTYAAMVSIPENFSKQATSFSKDDLADIEPAEIAIQTSEVSGITDGVVAQVITTVARETLNTELTKQYLNNIYLGFNTTKKQFQSVADGARELSDGAGGLSDGLDQVSAGSVKLADGLEQLDDGTQQLSTGMTKLADGTKELPTQTRQLANGARQTADGADELAGGVKQYVGGVKQLNQQLPMFTEGLGQAADGAKQLATGTSQLSTGMKQYAAGSKQFAGGLKDYSSAMSSFAQIEDPEELKGALAQIGVTCPEQLPEEACPAFLAGVAAGTAVAGAGMDNSVGEQPSLIEAADDLATGASTLSTNLGKVSTGVSGLSSGLAQLDTGAGKIEDGVGQLASNGTKLADGAKGLAGGLDQLADGTDKLATGLAQLSGGIRQTAAGTQQLASGTSQSATGGRQLSDGLVKLADGGSKLADGSDQLASGLEKGAKQIPTYDKQMRTALSNVVATPVTAERPASLFADIANTTLLSVLALWLGGLASFVVLRAIPSRVLTSMKPSWRLAGEALLPAAGVAVIQAIAMTITLQILLDLGTGQVAQLLPFLLLAGLSFVAVNHALVAWLGGVGRFISVAVVVLSVATAITHAIPEFLSGVVPFLPLTPAMEGARAIASGGPGAGGAAGLLLAWLLMGVAAGVLAVARHRVARVPGLVPAPA